jgi:DNA-binding transcriptional ArsR family regulator
MDSQSKKLAILHQLSQGAEPISLNELLQKLKDNYAGRSVRRWLIQLTQEGLVEKVGSRKGARYRVIQRSHRQANVAGQCFSLKSEGAINFIRRPVFERTPVAYVDEWTDAYQPNVSFYIPSEIRDQLQQAGRRSRGNDPAGTYAHQIFNRLLIDLSYNSSRLEGNTYSLLDTQKLIFEGTGAEGKLDEEKIMILNHKEAIRYLVDSAAKLKISEQTICTLHYLLSDSLVEARYGGKIRDHGVRVGGSTYIPFEDPKQLRIRLTRIAEKAD